jgi:transposase
MANRIKVAIAVSILTLRQQGWSFRRIAETLGVHRETVARHVRLAEAGAKPATNLSAGSEADGGPKPANLPAGRSPTAGEGLSAPSASLRTGGNSGPKSLCEPFREVVLQKLDQGLSAQRIWQDLAAEHGFGGRYASVKRFVRRLGKVSPLPFRRMESPPGQEAQIDFGPGAPVALPSGRRKRYPVLRVILSYSRKGYSEALPRQSTEDFIRALENAFRAFGGVPRTLVSDQLKAAVARADWYDPELNPKVEAFCRHYGCVVLPAKPYTPRHKGKVEAGVKYVSRNALMGKAFGSIAEENEELQHWEAHVADLRIHGTTKKQVRALFEAERPALLPLPATTFPFFHEAKRTVNRDAHVEVDKAYYSVPPEYLGRTVWARWDARMVRVFNGRMELIATHLKDQPGRFRTDPRHIASEKISGVERGASYLLRRISLVGPQSYSWAQTMLEQRGIEGVRVLQGLLAMTGKYPADDLEKACELALSHAAFRLQALRALLKDPTRQLQLIERHPLIRPMDFYGRLIRVSFGKEDDDTNHGNGEVTALGDAGGSPPHSNRRASLETEGPVRMEQIGPPAVHPPVSALGSLSSGALSSGPARESVPGQSALVNYDTEGIPHEEQYAGRPQEAAPERHGPVARPAAPGSPRQLPDPRGVSGAHPPG